MTDTTGAAGTGTSGERRTDGRWHGIALALTGGLVAASFMFFLIAAIQTPGLDPPPESAALFLVATTAGVISYGLLRGDDTAGYPAAMLTGTIVLAVVALVVAGTYGPAGPRTNPVGPISYVGLAVAVILTAGAAWRREGATESPSASSPTS
jgi:O-antigen/teichoic acid export membrane protein